MKSNTLVVKPHSKEDNLKCNILLIFRQFLVITIVSVDAGVRYVHCTGANTPRQRKRLS